MDKFTDWLLNVLTWLPKQVWKWLLDSIADVLTSIEVPSWLLSAQDALNNIPSGVLWFASLVQLPAGVAIIISAYIIRFLIRRIPLIG